MDAAGELGFVVALVSFSSPMNKREDEEEVGIFKNMKKSGEERNRRTWTWSPNDTIHMIHMAKSRGNPK